MKYIVNIEEILSRNIIVDAKNEEDAEYQVKQLYHSKKVVLDAGDFIGEPTIKCQRVCAENERLY